MVTISLTANTEASVVLGDKKHANIENLGDGYIYAGYNTGVTADAAGVMRVAPGGVKQLHNIAGKIYLLSTENTKAEVDGSNIFENFKKPSFAETVDGSTITADGGIISANYIGENLLENYDFAINQRGQTSYSGSNVYTVDRWYTGSAVVTVNDDCLTVAAPNAATTASLRQKISRGAELAGKIITASVDLDLITEGSRVCLQYKYNGAWTPAVYETQTGRRIISRTITFSDELTTDIEFAIMINTPATAGVVTQLKLYSAKIEIGDAATPFFPPDPADELAKCQRYYQIRSTNDIAAVDLRPTMCKTPTDIVAVTGGYAYIAEL